MRRIKIKDHLKRIGNGVQLEEEEEEEEEEE